jgi:outer membrane protein
MRKAMKRYLIILLLSISGLLMAGQYTLEDLIQAGLNNSYSLRQKNIMLRNSDLNIRSATFGLLPSVDVSASRTNTDGNYSSQGSLNIARSLTLTEPSFFNYKSAKLDKTIAQLDWQQAKKQLVYDIYSNWLDIAQTQKEIVIQNENLAVLQSIKDQADLQQRLGRRTSYDVNQTEINVINSQLAIASLRNQLTTQRATLFNLVKLQDDGSDFVFAESDAQTLNPDFSEFGAKPIALKQLQASIHKSKLDKLQSKLGLLPSLYVSGSFRESSVQNDVLDFANYDDSYTLSTGLSWSLWSPWTKGSSYAQSANSLTLKQWQLEEEQAALNLDRASLQRDWTYLTESLTLNARKSTQAKENLRIAQEKYNLGNLNLIELEQARVDALDAELAVNKITVQLQKKIQEWNLLNSLPLLEKY